MGRAEGAARYRGPSRRDAAFLTALASPEGDMAAQLWHHCLHLEATWRRDGERPTWRISVYALPNDPAALVARVEQDFPGFGQRPAP